MTTTTGAAEARQKITGAAWYALGVLTLVYMLNFLDRTLIYILFAPIKAEMKLSDFQLALLGPTAFVIFYTLLGVPFGRLADRAVRKRMIAAGLAVWSLFSGLTGFAEGFWALFFCRVMVGVGEATLGPAALSLLSDHFPPRVRATMQAVYSSGIAVGAAAASFLGGWLGETWGWRWAFYLVGFPGLALALLVLLIKEERRGATETAPARYDAGDWKVLLKSAPLRYLYAGYALFGLAANNLSIWGAIYFLRAHGFSLSYIGTVGGVFALAAGVPGTILGGALADKFGGRFGRGGRMLFGAAAALASVPLWLLLLFAGSQAGLLFAWFMLLALSLVWLGPAAADVHDVAGPKLRGLGIGIYFFAVNVAAYGIGAPLIGKLNDALGAAAAPTMMSYGLLVCPLACLLGALLLWLGSRSIGAGASHDEAAGKSV
ncbi:MAG TPA: MFS transporter [Pyrinomonadaceae bacterium]|nr:MFS transporter [Pyrinomonadaceae bacterium]